MYRPKFCVECGEKIIRLRWRVWTSQRFCAVCAPRFVREESVRLAVAGTTILLVGIFIGHATRRVPPVPLVQRNPEARTSSPSAAAGNGNFPAIVAEEVYSCGARTKKGTPCSRRVHGPVRCWQHKGMPAMLAQEKLRIRE